MQKNTIIAVAAAALAAALTASAQDEGAWESKLAAGLNLTDGNSDTMAFTLGASTERGTEDDFTKLGARYNYGESEGETTVENADASAKYRNVLSGKNYGYGMLDALTDDIADIDYRIVAGGGLGRYLVRDDANTVGIEAGAGYLWEDAGSSDNYMVMRFAEYSDHQLSETASVYQMVEYLPEVDDFGNYLLNAEAGVEAAINSTMALTVTVKNRYDAEPAPGNDENDLSVIAGLSVTL